MKALNHKKGTWEISSKEKEEIYNLANRNIQLMGVANALSDFIKHKGLQDELEAWVTSENERLKIEQEQKDLDAAIEALPDAKPKKARKTKELVN
jgi:hypothetical protein